MALQLFLNCKITRLLLIVFKTSSRSCLSEACSTVSDCGSEDGCSTAGECLEEAAGTAVSFVAFWLELTVTGNGDGLEYVSLGFVKSTTLGANLVSLSPHCQVFRFFCSLAEFVQILADLVFWGLLASFHLIIGLFDQMMTFMASFFLLSLSRTSL